MIETKRLYLRKLTMNDVEEMKGILQDERVMYAWERTFSDDEVVEWIEKNIARYEKDGFSHFAAIEKTTGEFVGVIGPLVETVHGMDYIGLAYMLKHDHWHKGYATEGAQACLTYAFEQLHADEVIAQIRPNNTASIHVAQRLGMKHVGSFIKHYKGNDMEHWIYCMTRDDFFKNK